MTEQQAPAHPSEQTRSFFDRPQVELTEIPVGPGVPLGIECVSNKQVGIGGAYGAWGKSYDNEALPSLIEKRMGEPLRDEDKMELASLGFVNRHHIPTLSAQQHLDVEVEVGARILRAAAQASGWEPGEVEGVLIGMSGPVAPDYTERIASEAGIPQEALKVSVHKACDGSVGGLQIALNPALEIFRSLGRNLAEELRGKKVLVGGIEGLSRFVEFSRDKNALQLFGNGAGVIGVIPGKTIKFLVGKTHEVFDEDGVLGVHMYYPHSHRKSEQGTNIEVSQDGPYHVRVSGLMNEPADGRPVSMAGPMGMVKLFVRSGVQVVRDVYGAYHELLGKLGRLEKNIEVAIVHHANLKINKLKEKHLNNEGIQMPMPWLLSEFGNVSAASNMIAFLRQLPNMKPGDHILIDGFGAGTYYDVMVVEMGA
jgi:3-oxoacyl-[acyl-carrier-protein] synthase III